MQAAEKEAEAEQRRGCYIDMFMRWLRGGGRRRRKRKQRAKKQKILSVSPLGERKAPKFAENESGFFGRIETIVLDCVEFYATAVMRI